ncbi:MAG: hypothetical protein AAB383_04815 [Patescibacteria group bacterium]
MADEQKKSAPEDVFSEEARVDVDAMTDKEIRMAASFTTDKVLKALIGDTTERKLAQRILQLEKKDKQEIKELEEIVGHRGQEHLKVFKKLLKKLEENPQFYPIFFEKINQRGVRIVYRLIDNFDILEVNFGVFEDFLALESSSGSLRKIALLRQLKDQYEFNPDFFHKVSKTLLSNNDFFDYYRDFPEYLDKASDLLVGIAKEHPNDLSRFQTAYDFMNLIRLGSMFGTIINECDAEFLTDRKSYDACLAFYEEQKKTGEMRLEAHLSLKIRFTYIGTKYPEYKALAEDVRIFGQFNGFLGDLKHMLYILSLYKKGERKGAEAVLSRMYNFKYVEEKDFEKAEPWVLAVGYLGGSRENYRKALNAYLRLRDRDEAQAQAYLEVFTGLGKEYKGYWDYDCVDSTLDLFEIYGDDLEALKVCILWAQEFRTPYGHELMAATKHFFHVYQRDPAEGMEYLQIFKDIAKIKYLEDPWLSLCLYHELYGEDLNKLKLIADVYTCVKSNSGVKILLENYKESPAEFEKAWPKVKEGLATLNAEIGDDSLSEDIKCCIFGDVESIAAMLGKLDLVTKFVRSEPALLMGKNKSATRWLLNCFDQVVRDESEFGLLKLFSEKFEYCVDGIENGNLVGPTMECAFKGQKNIKELTIRLQLIGTFVRACPVLFTDNKQLVFCHWILEHFDNLIKDRSSGDFINQVIGKHGKSAEEIVKGYEQCLLAGVITPGDKEMVLEFLDRYRVLSPAIISGYKKAKAEGTQEIYLARLNDIASRMTGAGKLTAQERTEPFYDDLLKEVYKNNAGKWTNAENNKSCEDRGADIAGYKIRPRYEIDLMSQSQISVKEGQSLDKGKTDELVKNVTDISAKFATCNYEPQVMKVDVLKMVDENFAKINHETRLSPAEAANLDIEEKMCMIILDAMYGDKKVNEKELKNLMISYEFAYFEDVRDYVQGTTDRVNQSSNRDYALLCELNTFFSDRVKEINKRVIQAGFKSPKISKIIPLYFEHLSRSEISGERKSKVEGMQPGKLGLTDAFIKQISKVLEKKGKKYTPDEIKELLARYEKSTRGLSEVASSSPKQRTKAFYGQLRSQRERTRQLAEYITGADVDPSKLQLGEINVAQLLETEQNISGGIYDAQQFEAYTVQNALNLFEDEKEFLATELLKFSSASGTEREILHGYIAKNKETANARMVGGVCVSGDNPKKVGKDCMWNMENYFELILEDPETHRCMGVVLLNAFEGDGKTLTAAFNPSSTYLYKVDEAALFKGLLSSIKVFAKENGFKRICTSQNKAIRTNRTGGIFERTMDAAITGVGKVYNFEEPKRFSFSPSYGMQAMDVLWEEGSQSAQAA